MSALLARFIKLGVEGDVDVAAALWRYRIELPSEVQLRVQVDFPNLVPNVLAVYKLTAKFKSQDKNPSCSGNVTGNII